MSNFKKVTFTDGRDAYVNIDLINCISTNRDKAGCTLHYLASSDDCTGAEILESPEYVLSIVPDGVLGDE